MEADISSGLDIVRKWGDSVVQEAGGMRPDW